MEQKYAEYAAQKAAELLAIDSPTGFTDRAAAWVQDAFGALGFAAKKTAKGGVLIDLGGAESEEGALLLQAHTDTLGAMVAEVKANGRLRVTNLGGMRAENGETENVRVYTRGGKVYEGTLQLCNASVHVNGDYGKTERTFDTTEVLLDEAVTSADETRALGIETGDIVCFDPRTRVTASGYIKSRFLDDKLSVGILLGFAKYLRDENKQLPRRTYVHVTVYEEVGHGGAGSVPAGVTESISVDMGCVGDGLRCTERQVDLRKGLRRPVQLRSRRQAHRRGQARGRGLRGRRLPALWLRRRGHAQRGLRHPPRPHRLRRLRQPRLRTQPQSRRPQHPEDPEGLSLCLSPSGQWLPL